MLVSDTDESESVGEGHKTDSTAKKQPATTALNPASEEENFLLTADYNFWGGRGSDGNRGVASRRDKEGEPEEIPAAEPAAERESFV